MPKTLKYLIITIVALAFILILTPLFIPTNSYKEKIVIKVRESTGRDLSINGDIKLSILPTPSLTLNEVTLSSIEGTKDPLMLSIKTAKADVSLFSLLKGNIEIANIVLDKMIVNLEVLENGKKNWEMKGKEISGSNTKEILENNKNIELPIFVSNIKIIDGTIIYICNNEQKIFNNIDLDTKIDSKKGPINFTLTTNGLGQNINIKGNISELADVIPLTASINISGERINIDGKFDIDNNSFIGNASLKGNTQNLGFPSELQNDYELITAITADNKNLKIKDARLNYSEIEFLGNGNYDISNNNLNANLVINPGNVVIELNGKQDKSEIFNANIKVQAQSFEPVIKALKFNIDKLPPLIHQELSLNTNISYSKQGVDLQNINFVSANTNLLGNIQLKNPQGNLNITHNLKISDASSFLSLFGVHCATNIGLVQLNGDIQKTKDSFNLSNKITIFGTNLTARGHINLFSAKPIFRLDIYSPFVNLDKIISSKNTPKSTTPWTNDKIDLSFLDNLQGQITASIDKLTQGSLTLDRIKANLSIENGKLNITSITSSIYGGQLAINGYAYSGKDQEVSLKIDLKNAYLKNIIPQNSKISVTDGQLNMQSSLNSHGNSSYKYISNLNGHFNLDSANGKISGFDLNKIVDAVNNIKNAQTIIRTINTSFNNGETSYKSLNVSGDINNGIVKLTEARLDATPAIASATGQINLPQYMLDINATVAIKNLPPLGVKLYGLLNNPQHKLDFKDLQTYLFKNVVNSVVKDLKNGEAKPENIIKDALGLRKKTSTEQQESNNKPETQENNSPPTDAVNKLLQKGLKKLF